jgi:plasmid stabilization system protein ParE
MTAELIVLPEAERDAAEAYDWYEARRAGLGEDFLTQLDAMLRAIARTPEMHAKFHKDYRRAVLRRFPYVVFDEYAAGKVTVYQVFHTSQNPSK